MAEPHIIITGNDEGMNNADLAKATDRLMAGRQYKDLSTLCVIPTRGVVPARVVESWWSLMTPMNSAFQRMMIVGMEVGEAYQQSVELLLSNPYLKNFKYLLWLEEDNAPPPDGLLKLLESICDCKVPCRDHFVQVAGLYWTKGHGTGQPMIYGDPKGLLTFQPQVPIPDQVQECVSPETMVLMSDLTWRAAGDVKQGDELFAPDENPPGGKRQRRMRKSVVESRHEFDGERLFVRTSEADITVSNDHGFLVAGAAGPLRWTRADQLVPGDRIKFVAQPWPDRSDSWMAGMMDGEANLAVSQDARGLNIAQNPGPVFDRVKGILDAAGIHYSVHKVDAGRYMCERVHITRVSDIHTALGSYRPTRIFPQADEKLLTAASMCLPPTTATVEWVAKMGTGPLVAMKTSTKTLITDGLVSHNCNGTGMGFTLLHAGVFKDKKYREISTPVGSKEPVWFKTINSPEEGLGTQDLYQMHRLRQAGFRIASDNRVRVGHFDLESNTMY